MTATFLKNCEARIFQMFPRMKHQQLVTFLLNILHFMDHKLQQVFTYRRKKYLLFFKNFFLCCTVFYNLFFSDGPFSFIYQVRPSLQSCDIKLRPTVTAFFENCLFLTTTVADFLRMISFQSKTLPQKLKWEGRSESSII